jgi:alpha-glucosidase
MPLKTNNFCHMKNLSLVLILFAFISCKQNNSVKLQSPNNKVQVSCHLNELSEIQYSVEYEGDTIVYPSSLGFQVEGEPDIGKNMEIIKTIETSVNQTWNPVYGERSEVMDIYNQVNIHLKETVSPKREFEITFRVYNEGVAFNYTFLPQSGEESIIIKNELTEFNLAENYECWVSDRAQSEISKKTINSIEKPAERPLVIEAGKNFLALGEAKLIDFARMKFLAGEKENSLVAELHGEAHITLPCTTPWRTIMIGKSAGELLENNYFLENLNDPCAIEDVSWIKPGKIIREVTLTTQGGFACVDFAAANGLQYVEFDAGWYGNEYDEASDATTITVDPKRSPGPLKLHEIIDYANSKGIGIIVYVNRRALEKQLDEILPLFKSWGIKGVKYGFVQVGSQEWTTWLHEAVKKAAENQLMVDIHDEYRPTGFSRTYPNLMTQEGIRGDEETPSNEHTLITLFTRMIAGAGDNTNCYYAPRVQESMGGNVSQLAKAVMLYSPWQFLYWYDRPQGSPGKKGGAGSSQGFIMNHPELEFFANMPAVWDESKVLEGEIGQYATVVRRSGNDWFLGSLTGKNSRSLQIKTDFLKAGEKYETMIYTFDPESESSTKVKIETKEVISVSDLSFDILKNSGLAIYFKKI